MALDIQGVRFYTVPETAEQLSCTDQTVRNYIKRGKLKAQRIGKPVYVSEISIREFLNIETAQR